MTAESLFDPAGNQAVLARIQKLRGDAKPQWGKMDAARMVAHGAVGLKLAMGDMKLKRVLIGLLFGRMAKKQLLRPEPFKRGLPTAREFRIQSTRGFETERAELVALVKRFAAGPSVLTKEAHPFFGELTTQEWDALQWKHLDHHLRQFGV